LNLVVWLNCLCGLDVVWAELYCRLEKKIGLIVWVIKQAGLKFVGWKRKYD